MPVVYVNIGSNLGDKRKLIEKALKGIGEEFGFYCVSGFVESEPWGFNSAKSFLNIGAAFYSDNHPEAILEKLQFIEKSINPASHRDKEGRYIDREIDIDIMAIDEMIYDSERLHIPHPHLLERDFFLKPLKELAPLWRHPFVH